jgi:hypothetical protein
MILPASPTKCPLPMLLANNDAPTYNANYLIIIFGKKRDLCFTGKNVIDRPARK